MQIYNKNGFLHTVSPKSKQGDRKCIYVKIPQVTMEYYNSENYFQSSNQFHIAQVF